MKVRQGFVSNSSSSSFVVSLNDVDSLSLIKFLGLDKNEGWNITVNEYTKTIHGYTDMDNFDMLDFMRNCGIDTSKVEWESD